ncbi:MAG: TonB-dependent receptor [Rhizobacter sp.]|nr:TonB-dependent receptor [Rhizobacter sp.]
MAALSSAAHAGGEQELPKVIVTGSSTSQVGVADSANVGTVTQKQLEARTVYRPGELLEAAPGLIVSQHSGEGKANQFYLRGFNLDHGTDLRTTVDGMLVNQRSHGHGQGWTDLNFVIPELATGLRYKKGPYYAIEGDFSAAGAVEITYADSLEAGIANLGIGQNGYRRVLLADSPALGAGKLLYALEAMRNDGPFDRPDDFRKLNGVLRYSQGDRANGWNLTGMGYSAEWNATDQIPLRAVESGELGRFALIDPTDGGKSHRYSLSGAWRQSTETSSTEVTAHVAHWNLELYSNFTYFLDNPDDGDQFAQPDRRTTSALNVRHAWASNWFGREGESQVGVQLQNDNIWNSLFNTKARQLIGVPTRSDHIVESSLGLWFDHAVRWTPAFRTVAGLRADSYRFDVESDRAVNSGTSTASIVSPKLNLIFGPWSKTEFYVNLGSGFHSNDARGTVISIDPITGQPKERVTPLARAKGYELGLRTSPVNGLQTSLSVYTLDLASELVFVGDAGTTEAGRPSRRVGFELANYYKFDDWLTLDADIAFARARFRDSAPEGQRIPGAVEGVASVAVAVDNLGPWFGALQWRYFGPRPLVEDNSVRSKATALLNGHIGYKLSPKVRLELEGFNLTNRKASAIDYYYTSRLFGEDPPEGKDDIHFHPMESRSFRLSLNVAF